MNFFIHMENMYGYISGTQLYLPVFTSNHKNRGRKGYHMANDKYYDSETHMNYLISRKTILRYKLKEVDGI